ncbi:MAG: hypothetical protein JNK85_22490 [Verrucomicrobiales bacterium]|nr:hypothetical protein [Verrucomicrobiales bacterium]
MNDNESTSSRPIDPDQLLTVAEFARWLGVGESWVRRRLRLLPGVIIESRETVRIHLRTYLDGRLKNQRHTTR